MISNFIIAMFKNLKKKKGELYINVFHVHCYIQNTVISTCNPYLKIINEIVLFCTKSSKHSVYYTRTDISIHTLHFHWK